MKTIIQQIATKFIEQVFESLSENGVNNIGQATQQLLEIAKTTTLEIVAAAIGQMDDALVTRQDGLRIKERDVPRTLLTDLGECGTNVYILK